MITKRDTERIDNQMQNENRFLAAVLGLVVGDAMGVPVELNHVKN